MLVTSNSLISGANRLRFGKKYFRYRKPVYCEEGYSLGLIVNL